MFSILKFSLPMFAVPMSYYLCSLYLCSLYLCSLYLCSLYLYSLYLSFSVAMFYLVCFSTPLYLSLFVSIFFLSLSFLFLFFLSIRFYISFTLYLLFLCSLSVFQSCWRRSTDLLRKIHYFLQRARPFRETATPLPQFVYDLRNVPIVRVLSHSRQSFYQTRLTFDQDALQVGQSNFAATMRVIISGIKLRYLHKFEPSREKVLVPILKVQKCPIENLPSTPNHASKSYFATVVLPKVSF